MRFSGKRLLILALSLVLLISLLPVGAWAAGEQLVYCLPPEDWEQCLIYWWGDVAHPEWPGVAMDRNEEGIWYYLVSSNAQGLIFNNGEGQKTGDLSVPQNDQIMFVVEKHLWSAYGDAEPEDRYYVAGFASLCGSSWHPSDENNRMRDSDRDGIYTKTYYDVDAGRYELKVTTGSWSESWGNEQGANYILDVERSGTDVTVCFDAEEKQISILWNGETPVPVYTLSGSVTGGRFQAVLTGSSGAVKYEGRGSYRFTDVTAGAYLLTFTAEGYVSRSYEVQIDEGDVTLDTQLRVLGDLTGDGKVNVGDVARLYAHTKRTELLTGYDLDCGDCTGDGKVNVGDTAMLYAQIQNTPVEPPKPNVSGTYVVGQDALPYTEEEIYQQLFDPYTKVEVDLDMPEEELQKLQEDYERYRNMGSKSPIYRMGDLTITLTTDAGTVRYVIKEVGARMKGNTSRTSFYSSDEGIYNYIHFKLDFQETFDDEDYYGEGFKVWDSEEARKERKNRTFATLEKLEMRWNKLYDATYLKESYAYDVFRSEGVLAPQCNVGVLTWSGAGMGIYTVQEPVDEIFIERNLPLEDQGGDLYKLGWTNEGATFTNTNSIGAEDEDKGKFYVYDIKTNKKKTTHEDLITMINTLNSGKLTKADFAQVVDVDNFLRFAAVSYFMGGCDDLRNNYNNCYVYFRKSTGQAVFIPYDYDRCLGVNREYNPSGHSMTKDSPYGEGNQKSPLYRYSVDEGGFYQSEFTQVLLEVAENELLTPEAFEDRFVIARGLYADQVTPERNLRNAQGRDFSFDLERSGSASGGSNMSFRDYILAKMSAFRGYMDQAEDVPQTGEYYIRGDFNNWNVEQAYVMTLEGEVLTYTIQSFNAVKFKVFDNRRQTWMGSECINPDNTVAYETDKRTNICLPGGTWKIYYNPATNLISMKPAIQNEWETQ